MTELDKVKESLEQYSGLLDNAIRIEKKGLINALDSLEMTLKHNRMRLEASLGDSTVTNLNALGIIQRQGQMIESRCMEVTTKAKHLSVLKQIIADGKVGK